MTTPDRDFDKLTEAQKRLLREVAKGRSSKTMSREVGLEPATIDVYLSQALKIIGAPDRRSAAAAFAEHEAAILIGSKLRSEGLATPPETVQPASRRGLKRFFRGIKPPPIGGREHDYDRNQRLVASFTIAIWGFAVIIVLSMVISALFWIFPKT